MEGQTLSHYRVLEKLGGGGMGVVYKALDTHLDRHVALKLLPPELTRDDDARERFVLEAKAASALDHPNICTIYDIDETSDRHMFIAMGYYEGETLKQRIGRGPLPVDEALDITIQVAQGLAEAHSADIIHRDVKPANLMLAKNGLVKIVDFGIAKLLGVTGPTQTGTTLGTVAYMSPEQVAGDEADQQSDVWSLGAVLYEMLTGKQPFTGDNHWAVMNAISNRPLESPDALRPEVSTNVSSVVVRALDKAKDARYPSAAAFSADLKTSHAELTQPVLQTAATGSAWQGSADAEDCGAWIAARVRSRYGRLLVRRFGRGCSMGTRGGIARNHATDRRRPVRGGLQAGDRSLGGHTGRSDLGESLDLDIRARLSLHGSSRRQRLLSRLLCSRG